MSLTLDLMKRAMEDYSDALNAPIAVLLRAIEIIRAQYAGLEGGASMAGADFAELYAYAAGRARWGDEEVRLLRSEAPTGESEDVQLLSALHVANVRRKSVALEKMSLVWAEAAHASGINLAAYDDLPPVPPPGVVRVARAVLVAGRYEARS
jgi:hypothetical protein